MRMAILGAGAVGAYVGGRLAQAGVPAAFLARGDHLHALARDGLRVDSPQGDFVVQPWLVTDDPTAIGVALQQENLLGEALRLVGNRPTLGDESMPQPREAHLLPDSVRVEGTQARGIAEERLDGVGLRAVQERFY